MNDVNRCGWCQDNGMMQKYHDEEWGVPLHDDKKQFEFLMMDAYVKEKADFQTVL